jgi:hypothetical protein
MHRGLPILCAGVILVGLMTGCGRGAKDALRFNDQIAGATQKLERAGASFSTSAGMAVEGGNPGDISNAEQALRLLKIQLQGAKDEATKMTVPPGKTTKELHDAYLRFLEVETTILDRDFEGIIAILKNTTMSLEDKETQVQIISNRAEKLEEPVLAALQIAQQKLAKEYGFALGK